MSDDEDEHPPVEEAPSAADPVAQRKQRKTAAREAERTNVFWRGVLADEVGRREIWKILDTSGAFRERFACGPNGFPQPEATWFHTGEQSNGQRFYQMLLRLDHAGTFLMLTEHHPDFQQLRTRRAVTDGTD